MQTKINIVDYISVITFEANNITSNKTFCQPCMGNFINLIPNNHNGSPCLMHTTDSELTMALDGTRPGKEDPSPPCKEHNYIK